MSPSARPLRRRDNGYTIGEMRGTLFRKGSLHWFPKTTRSAGGSVEAFAAPQSRRSGGADCQVSATQKNTSKGERHPKHFLGLKLIDKTMFCKVTLSKE